MAGWAASLPQVLAANQGGTSSTVRRYMPGAPEIYFAKAIDNSRLVKVDDPVRRRELGLFSIALCCLTLFTFVYLWQHFSAIEYGYKIEALRSQRDQLVDVNKTLRLEEASLRDPERIDSIARSLGMQMPVAGQVQRMDTMADYGGPQMARAAGVSVVSLP
ncbi:MAG TPA: cell division protein FtsL [Clostridia bacterium]|nr:cell division protein FtsL [Clostridia bacterium]